MLRRQFLTVGLEYGGTDRLGRLGQSSLQFQREAPSPGSAMRIVCFFIYMVTFVRFRPTSFDTIPLPRKK